MGARSGAREHEASRRMKTELLIQMDGLAKTEDFVFVLAASNVPWDLDMAMLRRLEKRIYVPLPGDTARQLMIEKHLGEEGRSQGVDFGVIASRTMGYSGADIVLLCKEAAMRPLRRLMKHLSTLDEQDPNNTKGQNMVLEPVTADDCQAALKTVKPSANHSFLTKYDDWTKQFGAGYSSMEDSERQQSDPPAAGGGYGAGFSASIDM